MNRRPSGPLSSRPNRNNGSFDAILGRLPLVLAAIAGIVLLGLIFLLASQCGGGGTQAQVASTAKAPPAPSGYVYASNFWKTHGTTTNKTAQALSVPLTDRSVTRGLSLFTYENGSWSRLAALQVSADGKSAGITQVLPEPANFAVLRRAAGDLQVFGTVPTGKQAGPDALRLMSGVVPLTYTPSADGSIRGGPVPVTAGASFGTYPAVAAEGGDAATAVSSILTDDARRSAHVANVAAEADRGGYDGIEIDYTAVDPGVRANFTAFVQALAARLHASKRKLILRLPLPRREGNNWNEGAYDWAELSKQADYLVIAAERDQSIYRTRVPDGVKYLTTRVGDPHKLVLEVSPLAEERSETGDIRTYSTAQALAIAGQITVRNPDQVFTDSDVTVSADNINREGGSGPQWTAEGVVSFVYRTDTDQRTVWIENVFSVGYKLEIAQLNKLGGVSVDDAESAPELTNIWPAIEQFQAAGAPTLAQPNPQALRPQWLVNGNVIADAGNRAVITWHTPTAPGRQTLSVIVSDGTIRVSNSIAVDVKVAVPGAPTPTPGPGGARTPTRTPATPTRAATQPSLAPNRTQTAPAR